jgi:hypothetical protein
MDSAELNAIRERCDAATPGPWESFVEGRDHLAAKASSGPAGSMIGVQTLS